MTGRLTQLCCPRDDPAEDNSTECDDQNIPVVPDADSAWCGLQLQSSLCFLHPHPGAFSAERTPCICICIWLPPIAPSLSVAPSLPFCVQFREMRLALSTSYIRFTSKLLVLLVLLVLRVCSCAAVKKSALSVCLAIGETVILLTLSLHPY